MLLGHLLLLGSFTLLGPAPWLPLAPSLPLTLCSLLLQVRHNRFCTQTVLLQGAGAALVVVSSYSACLLSTMAGDNILLKNLSKILN